MLKITAVYPGGYAADIGLEVGDQLLTMNGHVIDDLVDYHLFVEETSLFCEILKADGEVWELEIDKLPAEDLGIEVEHPHPRQCGNRCLFCFIHQLPQGMRRSLYIKDEDYRFSYLYGSYMTLTNLDEADMSRIIRQKLSPLYVSVHAVDEDVRRRLLDVEAPGIKDLISRLTKNGIELHTQIVLCPGINDGPVLDETIEYLGGFPHILSLAVVPVGLTQFRKNLPHLTAVNQDIARECLRRIEKHQKRYLRERKSRFVFAADEFYLLADENFPPFTNYEDFPQAENGVGMIVRFRQQSEDVLADAEPIDLNKVTLITGRSFAAELQQFAGRLELQTGVNCQVTVINNDFFGHMVTVAGLLTGQDMVSSLSGQNLGDAVIIPDVTLKDGQGLFLDDMTVEQLESALGVDVLVVESSPWGILDGMEQLAHGAIEVVHCHE